MATLEWSYVIMKRFKAPYVLLTRMVTFVANAMGPSSMG
jgi:hypothetical protein